MALISRYRKLSRSPIDDQRNTVGINEMAIIATLNKRSSRLLSLAILMRINVAKTEQAIARKRIENKSVKPRYVSNFAGR
jgi:hypothetical protein